MLRIFWKEGYFFEKICKLCMRGLIIVAERWIEGKQASELVRDIFFLRILVKFDVKLDPRIFIYWLISKTLSLVFVYMYMHSLTCMCSCASVFLCVSWKWQTNFADRTFLITLHTLFPNWDYWKHSLKRRFKNR